MYKYISADIITRYVVIGYNSTHKNSEYMRKMGRSWVRKSGNYKDRFAEKYISKETTK